MVRAVCHKIRDAESRSGMTIAPGTGTPAPPRVPRIGQPDSASQHVPTTPWLCCSGHAVGRAVVAGRHRHLASELAAEMARIAEAPAEGDRRDRKTGADEIVTRRCEPTRSNDRADGVTGSSKGPMHRARCDVE